MVGSRPSWPRSGEHALATARPGIESWTAHDRTPLHRHADGYAALVLSGGYAEVGSNGRFQVRAGEVLLHFPFDAHFNWFEQSGARLLNLPLQKDIGFSFGRVDDPDAVARVAETDAECASVLLLQLIRPLAPQLRDWPDILAQDLISDPGIRLDSWARERGLAPATVSRGFRKAFGVSPVAFRGEVRAQRALRQIVHDSTSLASAAADAYFADQAHMSRAIKAMTGHSPGFWAKVK